ncbi:MAG TPA: sigma-70 family RNA polymerase sigma factor, partial [Lacipirellulaceae bacterium]|nr:sigma-70 family RNA polymerase sigma factor [Lacipirellulaceae bacterium]
MSRQSGPTPPDEPAPADHDAFVLQVIDAQPRLYSYILSLTLDREAARDILQQANLVLLEKEADYTPGTNFIAWACRVAFYTVLGERRSRQRDRLKFSDELLSMIAVSAEHEASRSDERAAALRACLGRLAEEQRELVLARYGNGASVTDIARAANKTPNA